MSVIVPLTGEEGHVVARMTVHRNEIVEFNTTNDGPDRFIAVVHAKEVPEKKTVLMGITMKGKPPDWFGKPHQLAILAQLKAHRHDMEIEYYRMTNERLSKIGRQ